MPDDRRLLTFSDRASWRAWLKSNHDRLTEAWLVIYKKGKKEGALTLDEAVEEALCFGWIDGKLKSHDEVCYTLRFSPRKSNSIWSISNVRRSKALIEQGLMTDAGMEKVKEAHRSGQWETAIRREQTDVIPPELHKELRKRKGGLARYRSLTDSRKKQLLHWLLTAKRPETKQRRIEAIVQEVTSRR